MKPEEKAPKQPLLPAQYTRKTKDDFLRWLKEKEALKQQTPEAKNP
jgi:hypothetical protein